MNDLVFSAPVPSRDLRNTQLATVDDALAMIRSERFAPYRYTKNGNERPAWTDALEALTAAQARKSADTTATARSATVRLIAFADRFLDRAVEHQSSDWRLTHLKPAVGLVPLEPQP